MDQNIQKALWLGVGILFFVGVISTGLYLFQKGQAVAQSSGQQLDQMNKKLMESTLEPYNNEEVSGSETLNAIKYYQDQTGEFLVYVETKYPSNHTYISSGSLSAQVLTSALTSKSRSQIDNEVQAAKDETSTYYINPSGKFYARWIYDNNDVIKGISFIQE